MESVKSKDIIIIIVGLIISAILAFMSSSLYFDFNNFITVYIILILTLVIIGGIIWAINVNLNEIKQDLKEQKIEQKRLGEKLKIYEQLINMKAEIKRLPKNSLSPQQADGVFSRIFSLRDQQSLISKLAQQAAGY